jgi:hypothetical protein
MHRIAVSLMVACVARAGFAQSPLRPSAATRVVTTAPSRTLAQPSPHTLSPALRIEAAVSPAPVALRAGATVLDYDSTGKLVTVRPGTNPLICLADNPVQKSFHVACYDRELEPFMARGRALRAQHVSSDETDSIRAREIRSGTLAMPRHPTALYQYVASRDSVDGADGVIHGAMYLYLAYIPFATTASTGFPAEPLTNGGPWLMYPGKPWAHLMIGPPQPATITLGK